MLAKLGVAKRRITSPWPSVGSTPERWAVGEGRDSTPARSPSSRSRRSRCAKAAGFRQVLAESGDFFPSYQGGVIAGAAGLGRCERRGDHWAASWASIVEGRAPGCSIPPIARLRRRHPRRADARNPAQGVLEAVMASLLSPAIGSHAGRRYSCARAWPRCSTCGPAMAVRTTLTDAQRYLWPRALPAGASPPGLKPRISILVDHGYKLSTPDAYDLAGWLNVSLDMDASFAFKAVGQPLKPQGRRAADHRQAAASPTISALPGHGVTRRWSARPIRTRRSSASTVRRRAGDGRRARRLHGRRPEARRRAGRDSA